MLLSPSGMHTMLDASGHRHPQGRSPQNVLSYYVHGNPFVQADGSPAEYTLGGMRTAYATRLHVSHQHQRHSNSEPQSAYNRKTPTHSLPPSIPDTMHAPPLSQPQASQHSFYPGFFPGHRMVHSLNDTSPVILPHPQLAYGPSAQHMVPARTPPTPTLTEDERSTATSPDRVDGHGFPPAADTAWMLHAALTNSASARAWQDPRNRWVSEHEEFQEPVYAKPQPGVGPRGHVLGGVALKLPHPPYPPPAPAPASFSAAHSPSETGSMWGNGWTESMQAYNVSPNGSPLREPRVGPTGHVLGSAPAPQPRPRGVGPNGHVLGGGKPEDQQPSSEVLYDTSRPMQRAPSLPASSVHAPTLQITASPAGCVRPPIVPQEGAGLCVPSQSEAMTRARPRALSRASSMNLRNDLDTVVEVEEPMPSPRLPLLVQKPTRSFPICEEDDSEEDTHTDLSIAFSEESGVVSPGLPTPKDDLLDGSNPFTPFVVSSTPSVSAEDVRYYDERHHVVSLASKDIAPVVNLPNNLPVPKSKPLSRKARRRAGKR